MKKILQIIVIIGLFSCSSEPSSNENKKAIEKADDVEVSSCNKCDFELIKYAGDNWDKLDKEVLEKFLCAFDDSCNWTSEMMYTREHQKFGIAWDLLFVLFDKYFDEYIEILEINKSINRNYLISLFSEPAIYDLPHTQILNKLKEKDDKTDFQSQLVEVFTKSIAEGDKIFDGSKKE